MIGISNLSRTFPRTPVCAGSALWGFAATDSGRDWHGEVAGPDRLRFIGMLSRHVALIEHLSLTERSA